MGKFKMAIGSLFSLVLISGITAGTFARADELVSVGTLGTRIASCTFTQAVPDAYSKAFSLFNSNIGGFLVTDDALVGGNLDGSETSLIFTASLTQSGFNFDPSTGNGEFKDQAGNRFPINCKT